MGDAIDEALRAFRDELGSEAVVSASIDELVDHLRDIIDARIAAGDDVESAIRTARERLGEPKALARECGRVRSAFGPRPSRTVAWLIAGLVATWFGLWISFDGQIVTTGLFRAAVVVVVALALRSPHAIAFTLGCAASASLWFLRVAAMLWGEGLATDETRRHMLSLVIALASVVLIAKSTKLTRASLAMVALGFALCGLHFGSLGEWVLPYANELALFGSIAIGIAIAMTAFRLPGAWIACLVCGALGLPYLQYIGGHHPNGEPYMDLYEAVRVNLACVVAPIVAAIAMRKQSRPLAEVVRRRRNGPTATA